MKKLIYSNILLFMLCGANKVYSGTEEAFLFANTASCVAGAAIPQTTTVGADGIGTSDDTATEIEGVSAKKEQEEQTPFNTMEIVSTIARYLDAPSAVNLLKTGVRPLLPIIEQRRLLSKDHHKQCIEVISQLMIGNHDVLNDEQGRAGYDNLLISLGLSMGNQEKPNCASIARTLSASVMNKRLITAADLQAYVTERTEKPNSHAEGGYAQSAAADEEEAPAEAGATEQRNVPPQGTMFYFTQEELTQHNALFAQLRGIETKATLMLQPTVNEHGVINVNTEPNAELQDYMQSVIIVDPQKKVLTIGYDFCAETKALQCLTLHCEALKTIGNFFCLGSALQKLTLHCEALETIGCCFCADAQALEYVALILSGNVKHIGPKLFNGCASLKKVTISKGWPNEQMVRDALEENAPEVQVTTVDPSDDHDA